VDGKVAGSEIVSTTPVEQPVDQVTLVGTKKKPSAYAIVDTSGTVTDQDGNPVNFKRKISGKCTAYTGGGTTSTGRAAAVGLVAVNPNVIPYGTRLYICSPDGRTVYGYAIAADTGGFAKQGRIIADLYYNTSSQCSSFGVRNMNIYVL
jgi:3D (Asp-Asp-Asp) domain-containing protein